MQPSCFNVEKVGVVVVVVLAVEGGGTADSIHIW